MSFYQLENNLVLLKAPETASLYYNNNQIPINMTIETNKYGFNELVVEAEVENPFAGTFFRSLYLERTEKSKNFQSI